MKSYSSTRLGTLDRVRELWTLYRAENRVERTVAAVIADMADMAEIVREKCGLRLENIKILDVGAGPSLAHTSWLTAKNQVIGVDSDLVPQGWRPLQYYKLLRTNGLMRFVKTVGRKALGLDRKLRARLARELGVKRIPPLDIRQMDTTEMSFPDNSFDLVFSRSVFEHLPDPRAVLKEMVRVARPGGGVYVELHLYTSDSGCHDVRILSGNRGGLPFWSHLRPQHRHKVRESVYLNRLRLFDWRQVFEELLPDATIILPEPRDSRTAERLARLRQDGELGEYSDEELLTVAVRAMWKKPEAPSRR